MDKIYTDFVNYGGEGHIGFVYCNVEQGTPTDGAVTMVGVPAAPSATAVDVAGIQPQYTVEYKLPPFSQQYNIKSELKEDKANSLTSHTQTHVSDVRTQTEMVVVAPPTPYFAHVMQEVTQAFAAEEKKQALSPQQNVEEELTITLKKERRRQKVADPKSWTSNIRKIKHQRGEAYVSRRGKFVPERRVKCMKDCRTSCKLHCSQQLSDIDRQHIFKAFYSLSSNEKKHFLLNTTERHCVKRPLKLGNDDQPKRKYSFKYFFLVRAVRYNVCKAFYLGTLAISQKPIYNVHANKSDMNLPKPDGRGLAPNSNHAIPSDRKQKVRDHIASFPTLDANGSTDPNRRKYLDSALSVKKMHHMYVLECNREGSAPVKESMYRKIFNTEFNLHFKKDKVKVERCENCKHPIKRKNS